MCVRQVQVQMSGSTVEVGVVGVLLERAAAEVDEADVDLSGGRLERRGHNDAAGNTRGV